MAMVRGTLILAATLGCISPGDVKADPVKCLKATDAVAGELRKVTSRRPSNREEITGWHILTSEPLCVTIGDSAVSNLNDIQVVFGKDADLKDLDDSLGWSVGFKGRMEYRPDDSYTGDVLIMDAVRYGDLDDAGEVRRK